MIIDVSKWQGKIDWTKVKSTLGLEGVYIKATEGVGYTDSNFSSNVAGAISTNIPIGVYHFGTLNSQAVAVDAIKEAQYFLSVIKPVKTSLPLVLDIERNDIKLSKDLVLLYINSFFGELKRQGTEEYVLYSYTPFLDENLPENHNLGSIKLWLASYTQKPVYPKGWNSLWLWQYSQKGFINGISGNVDLNKKPM